MVSKQEARFEKDIRDGACTLLKAWELKRFDPNAPFFQEIPFSISEFLVGIRGLIASVTGEPVELISSRRGLELLLLLTAGQVDFPLPKKVQEGLLLNIFGPMATDVEVRGGEIVLIHVPDETVH